MRLSTCRALTNIAADMICRRHNELLRPCCRSRHTDWASYLCICVGTAKDAERHRALPGASWRILERLRSQGHSNGWKRCQICHCKLFTGVPYEGIDACCSHQSHHFLEECCPGSLCLQGKSTTYKVLAGMSQHSQTSGLLPSALQAVDVKSHPAQQRLAESGVQCMCYVRHAAACKHLCIC